MTSCRAGGLCLSCGLGHEENEEVTGVRVSGPGEVRLARKKSSPYLTGNSEHGVGSLLNHANWGAEATVPK